MSPDDRIRITHIADFLGHAIRFVEGRKREDLDSDAMLTLALIQAIQTVGEGASKVSPETREQLPQIPWAVIIGMRHRLVHAYANVNPDILWTTATDAAPKLLAQVNAILETE